MKKILFSVVATLGLFATANAQDTFRKDDNVLNLGIGVSSTGTMSLPPLSATYERCIVDNIIEKGSLGLGAQGEILAYQGAGVALFAGPRFSFHYEFVENLDTYVGIQAGFALASSTVAFGTDGILGARYYLGNKWGIFGEFGTGLSAFKLGATIRL